MRMSKTTVDQFAAAVRAANQNYDGNLRVHADVHAAGSATIGRVDVHDSRGKGARTTASGRRGPFACWHAYRDVLSALFDLCPDAVVTTAMARYAGRDGFESAYPATAYKNVGSMFSPAYMPDLCDCES